MAEQHGANRLAGETSPYLLQHKDNPVAWHPWGREALDAAKRENKPILLSVGYAACHWCHVMAHESFEDPEVAEVMNRHFINIKVDREERPDLDHIYQNAIALLGQHGGWPLTMFLTPDGEPFWGGTYFPRFDRYGMAGLPRVLETIANVWNQEPDKVQTNVTRLRDALQGMAQPQGGGDVDPAMLDEAANRLAQSVDPTHGGIGTQPKFPQPAILAMLFRGWVRSGTEQAREGALLTLRRMSQGGIYDHLGGGFARYSVDERWLVPHFEKMLYDNAQLLEALTWAWQETGDALFHRRVHDTVGWLLREMIALDANGEPTGAFAASLDADSEGEEGKFYVWTEAEIDHVLGGDAELFKRVYDVSGEGNWENGKTILNRLNAPNSLGEGAESKLAACRARLFAVRERRVRPGWDDKVLADWNGLAIAALAEAGAAFGETAWLHAAARAFSFVRDNMDRDGRLLHAWRRGQAQHAGTLDDYAAMARAALTLHEHTGKPTYLADAERWAATLDRHFWDAENGGYFITADDVDDVILRPKHAHDSAQPSGNGLALGVLARLACFTGNTAYRERAHALTRAFAGELSRNFVPLCTLLANVELLNASTQIAIIGDRGRDDTQALIRVVERTLLPNRVLQVVAPDAALPDGHPAAGKAQLDGRPTAYVCHGATCSQPVSDPEALRQLLR
ncbi:hypothetical protein SAMN05216241_10773 [Limimonas halophila]|uniref:Spermatogenesis-associated protein 20-like TRX domain-containing protein n=1 Tax=Limimonas halophila TaxID=1082479 RepID=A0A1G7SNB8_9PROT|nr:thioredoxin domain-containing protein [Limimonas halophila]SDG24334.1 hypothetical protein SAMN05216241_10773 [Limimonas halophila]